MQHVMVDLETMGTAPGSAIISIGAVAFDPLKGLGDTFYRIISLESCQQARLGIEAGTVLWWMKQSDAARAQFDRKGEPLYDVLIAFSAWWRDQGAKVIWGHGGNFDEPLLSATYRAVELGPPWRFWDSRCTRTIYALAGEAPNRAKGVHHNALDDARAQAEAVVRSYAKLGVRV